MSQKSKHWNPFDNHLFNDVENDQLPHEHIPLDPEEFYEWVGLINHPRTGEPVKNLTWWQYAIWKARFEFKRRLAIKSQKVGETFSATDEDLQCALLFNRGQDVLLVGQTQDQANEHLLKLKTRVINSVNASKYLITQPSELLFREEKTKVKVAIFKNPDNSKRPSRIIALGMAESGMWSWSNVGHIHMSDPTVANVKDDAPLFAAAFSRLANTDGTMLIETPPRGPRGKTFEIYNQYLMKQENLGPRDFKIFHVTAQDAVKAGLILQEFLDEERIRLGALYPQYYEAEFIAVSGNLFTQASIDKATQHQYNPEKFNPLSEKYIIADQGYITSKFAVLVAEYNQYTKRIQILLAEEIQSPSYEKMLDRILYYRSKFGNVQNIGIDATSRMEFAMSLKTRIGEPDRIDRVKKIMDESKAKGYDLAKRMHVVPIIFSTESKEFMSSHSRRILDDPRGLIAIHPSFMNLIVALRSAVFDDKGMLDKDLSPHNDLTDCFMMLSTFLHFRKND